MFHRDFAGSTTRVEVVRNGGGHASVIWAWDQPRRIEIVQDINYTRGTFTSHVVKLLPGQAIMLKGTTIHRGGGLATCGIAFFVYLLQAPSRRGAGQTRGWQQRLTQDQGWPGVMNLADINLSDDPLNPTRGRRASARGEGGGGGGGGGHRR